MGLWTDRVEERVNTELAAQLGIRVDGVFRYATNAVAEYVIGVVLASYRQILIEARDTRRGTWRMEYLKTGHASTAAESVTEDELQGKTLGIVGMGAIGQRVAALASAFGMSILHAGAHPSEPSTQLPGTRVSLNDLVTQSHVVTLHVPQTIAAPVLTRELIAEMKPGTLLVNTSTGKALDQVAALQAARDGRIRLVLDVYEDLPPRHDLNSVPSSSGLFTYRRAWFTRSAIQRKGDALIANLRRFFDVGPAGRGGTATANTP